MDCTVHGLYSPWNSLGQKEYWSGQTFPSPGDLPNPGIEPGSPALQVDALPTDIMDSLPTEPQEKKGNMKDKGD